MYARVLLCCICFVLMLLASGLGHEWWKEATACYCFLRNVTDVVADGQTAWEKRFGSKFYGPIYLFGCRVVCEHFETLTL